MVRLAIFGSGKGSNAEKIIHFFNNHAEIKVSLVVSNVADAGILKIAENHSIEQQFVSKKTLHEDAAAVLQMLVEKKIDYIILAGYLLLIPTLIISEFRNKIINIHPALLPAYGGKGMYGAKVHESVIANNEKQSGITIHLVNEEYDRGEILFQAICAVDAEDNPDTLAQKIHHLEHQYFPAVIEKYIKS